MISKILFLFLEFLCSFTLIFVFYRYVVIKKEKFDKKKLPVELNLFIKLYSPNVRKISYEKLMSHLSIIIAFDISIILLITEVTDKLILKLVLGFVLILFFLKISFDLYAKYLNKRGMIKHE